MCAIAKVSIAPNAKIPARKSMSFGSASPKAIRAAAVITTYGVPRRGWRRPIALGIWRLVASE